MSAKTLMNYVAGEWRTPNAFFADVHDPATAETLACVPLSDREEVDRAATAAAEAFEGWRRTPPTERIQYLFRLKHLLEQHFDEIARTTTKECGKTLAEAQGELRRGIENVEVATGIPSLMMGYNLEDIASGIDEFMIRQPVGVVATITPFNFPAMIPLWFLPYAVACGNTLICKPSEKVPMTMKRIFELIEQCDFPPGVLNLVNGAGETVEAILEHPVIRAVSFVGSSTVAKLIYSRSAAHGKRVQASGGAKNLVVVLPDADMEMTTRIVADSAFGCAGQRCLASSVAVTVGKAGEAFTSRIAQAATDRRVGYGLEPNVEMGPVISPQSRERILGLIELGTSEGAELLVDGRSRPVADLPNGNFIRPTVLNNVNPQGELARTEIFGPVLSLIHAADIDEAIELVNRSAYGNMACLFTSSGAAARKFRYEARAGNIGINVGVAAPMAFFPFSGFRESFFGDLHPQGQDAVDFYTEKKVVVERWPKEWSRKF